MRKILLAATYPPTRHAIQTMHELGIEPTF
ncbi:MAG: hypothetical protein AVDCRST_MAG02-3837 [uncultured Rubrobacteraceae bacterium]|uniref:Uncharacterized protein n=1 Tax=uncultured Rubrobacteraceae bacterium TaxID=349277 RepID=A0A6J4RQD2_9ACTN|nr:MAG: hypothetical protein AVDCRST_MAG02-3837 [uncultured Rubrobacteraceae bacterium]